MEVDRSARIRAAFGRAAAGYEAHAGPQRWAVERLSTMARDIDVPGAPRVLEVGCGTGLLTRRLRTLWPQAELTATDIAPEMTATTAALDVADHVAVMDGGAPTLPGSYDVIASSLTLQWLAEPAVALQCWLDLLRPGGWLLFSTMGQGSFARWNAAHAATGLQAGTPDYPDAAALAAMLPAECTVRLEEGRHEVALPDAAALLHHLRGIGARVSRTDHTPLSAGALRRVMRRFEQDGASIQYHLLFVAARK